SSISGLHKPGIGSRVSNLSIRELGGSLGGTVARAETPMLNPLYRNQMAGNPSVTDEQLRPSSIFRKTKPEQRTTKFSSCAFPQGDVRYGPNEGTATAQALRHQADTRLRLQRSRPEPSQ